MTEVLIHHCIKLANHVQLNCHIIDDLFMSTDHQTWCKNALE